MKLDINQLWKRGVTDFKYTESYWFLNNRNGRFSNVKNQLRIYAR